MRHINIHHTLLTALIASAALTACNDKPVIDSPEIETTDLLQFNVAGAKIDQWSRANSYDPLNPWTSLPMNDNRLYPRDFIEKDVDYEPEFFTQSTDPDRFSKPLGKFKDSDVHNGPYIEHIRPVMFPLESSAGGARMEMSVQPMTDELMQKLGITNAAAQASRSLLVDQSNINEQYRNIGVTGICYYNDNNVDFDDNTSRIMTMDNERITFGGGDIWNTTSSTWFWNELGEDTEINRIRFFAYAPYELRDFEQTDFHDTGLNTPSFGYRIPESVDDHVDIAATAVTAPGDYYRSVPLKFNHLLTGVRFLIDDEYMANNVQRITIRGVHGEGDYTWTVRPDYLATAEDDGNVEKGTWKQTDQPDREFSLDRDNGDFHKAQLDALDKDGDRWAITDDNHIFLMMPQVLQNGAEVIIEFTKESGEPTLRGRLDRPSAEAKDPQEWKQGYLVTYLIQTYDIKYVLKLVKNGGHYPYSGGYDDMTVVSYALYYGKGSTQLKKILPVEWEPVWYDRNENEVPAPDWAKVRYDRPADAPEEYLPGNTDGRYPYFEDEYDFEELNVCHGHVDVAAQGSMASDPHYMAMRNAEPVGTADNPIDLSGGTPGNPMNTANCYIINAPGYYNIPLVYGNAFKNGAPNPQAYASESFRTHTDQPIAAVGPWLKDAAKIKDAATMSTNARDAVQLVHLSDQYLTVYVDSVFIDQGNSTLCVRDDNGDIMWSWHIWTTDYNPYIQTNLRTIESNNPGETFDFMTIDLGWHYPEIEGNTSERAIMWRPVQQCRNKGEVLIRTTPDYYHILQDGTETTYGYAPYYNWGRKDPLLKSVHTSKGQELFGNGYFTSYDFRRLHDNTQLTSAGFSLEQGHYYAMQPSLADAVKLPWFTPAYYNFREPGGTNIYEYATWWGGHPDHQITNPGPIPPKSGQPWPTVTGYALNGYSSGGSITYIRYDDLWCGGLTSDNYLVGTRQVVKTVYDPCPPGFCIPPNRAYDKINQAHSVKRNHPEMGYYDYMKYRMADLSVGYTFYISDAATAADDVSDASTINFPAATFLSIRAATNYPFQNGNHPYYGLCTFIPYLNATMNQVCSLWTADIASVRMSYNYIYMGSIFNIDGNFIVDMKDMNGAGPTMQSLTVHRATQNLASAGGRHVRAVKEK